MRYKFLGFLVPVFMASIVLLIGLCYHKTSSYHAKHREELVEAIRILEEAKHESETAARFLDSLTHVLRKRKVSPVGHREMLLPVAPNTEATTTTQHAFGQVPLPMSTSSLLGGNQTVITDEMYSNSEDLSTCFNELAQSFEQGTEVASLDWSNMFAGIDSSMIWV